MSSYAEHGMGDMFDDFDDPMEDIVDAIMGFLTELKITDMDDVEVSDDALKYMLREALSEFEFINDEEL